MGINAQYYNYKTPLITLRGSKISSKENSDQKNNLNITPFESNKTPTALIKAYFTGNMMTERLDTISFGHTSRKEQYESLSTKEKQKINKQLKKLIKSPDVAYTLIGKKPAMFEPGCVDEELFKTLRSYKHILDSENIKFITHKETGGIFMVNLPEARKIIEKNIDYFRYKLDNSSLTCDQILNSSLDPDNSWMFNPKNRDLQGIMLGYNFADSILYQLDQDIALNTKFLTERGLGKSKQVHLLEILSLLIRPDEEWLSFKEAIAGLKCNNKDINDLEINEDHRFLYNIFIKIKDMIGSEIPFPETSIENSPYTFTTWDKGSKDSEMNEIRQKNDDGAKELKKYKNPNTLLKYFWEIP